MVTKSSKSKLKRFDPTKIAKFRSYKLEREQACFGKQPHTFTKVYEPQRVDNTNELRANSEGQQKRGPYLGPTDPPYIEYDVCTNTDTKGDGTHVRCEYKVAVDLGMPF